MPVMMPARRRLVVVHAVGGELATSSRNGEPGSSSVLHALARQQLAARDVLGAAPPRRRPAPTRATCARRSATSASIAPRWRGRHRCAGSAGFGERSLLGGASLDPSYRFAGAPSNATFFLDCTRGRMALNIKSAATDRLVRELAALTGESITEAVTRAVELRLEQRAAGAASRRARCCALKILLRRYRGRGARCRSSTLARRRDPRLQRVGYASTDGRRQLARWSAFSWMSPKRFDPRRARSGRSPIVSALTLFECRTVLWTRFGAEMLQGLQI